MRLRHPNIVRIYDYGRDPQGHVYMVQEFVEGQPLDALLRAHGKLPAPAVVRIAVQALDALHAAHAAGIVHRDIKPGNLMVQGELDAGRVQLLDFGIAKISGADDDDQSELTRPGGAPGTPAYMAPEQINGHAEPASDLYALGATLFCLLTGTKPFPYSGHRIYMAHMLEPVPELPADVPPALAAVVRRAMAKDPGDRFEGARAMAAALEPGPYEGSTVLLAPPEATVALSPLSSATAVPLSLAEADDTVTSTRSPVPSMLHSAARGRGPGFDFGREPRCSACDGGAGGAEAPAPPAVVGGYRLARRARPRGGRGAPVER